MNETQKMYIYNEVSILTGYSKYRCYVTEFCFQIYIFAANQNWVCYCDDCTALKIKRLLSRNLIGSSIWNCGMQTLTIWRTSTWSLDHFSIPNGFDLINQFRNLISFCNRNISCNSICVAITTIHIGRVTFWKMHFFFVCTIILFVRWKTSWFFCVI